MEVDTKSSWKPGGKNPVGVEARALVPGARVGAKGWFQEQVRRPGRVPGADVEANDWEEEKVWRPATKSSYKPGGKKPVGVEARALVPGERVGSRAGTRSRYRGQGRVPGTDVEAYGLEEEQVWRPGTGTRSRCRGQLLVPGADVKISG